jgi:uncharacterized protein (TIGR03435 family)
MNRLAFVLLCSVMAASLGAQQPPASAFDVASVKPSGKNPGTGNCNPPTCYTSYYRMPPGRFIANRMPVLDLVAFAYSIPSNRVFGPEWSKSEEYDVEATHRLPQSTQSALMPMLQLLLQERFSLRLHREQRPLPVYLLRKARDDGRLGPQLLSLPVTTYADLCKSTPTFPAARAACGTLGLPAATSRVGRGTWIDLRLYQQLSFAVDRPVIDETGLNGFFEMRLEWSDENPPTGDKPSLFTAMQEQLGLKLEAAERPLEVLVIDSVERPTPN